MEKKQGNALQLLDVTKVYGQGDTAVEALKGINLTFRKSEFVSILGPSGCGKTTLLNIIGGLDRYTTGDLKINGVSTNEYKDRDWDTYRNHSIGFVFQSYNLISHQTTLQNVEIALTISGVGKAQRRERAINALRAVGLGDQIHKKQSEMSGGQMQRVAIARALVNNPDIILADEPTGALDTETSLQIMELLKEVAKDRLVIMVTHNPELAEKYSSRIIKMVDGVVTSDSMPVTIDESIIEIEQAEENSNNSSVEETVNKKKKAKKQKVKKPSMSFFTAFKLSLKNLFTKRGRTILTSFAGSIGIIGIALILAVSQGMTSYIDYIQESTLSSYPLSIESTALDLTEMMQSLMSVGDEDDNPHDKDAVYKEAIITELVNAYSKAETSENDLKAFKEYIEREKNTEGSKLNSALSGVQYTYGLDLNVYTKNVDGAIIKSDTKKLMQEMLSKFFSGSLNNSNSVVGSMGDQASSSSSMLSTMMMGSSSLWQELLPANDGSPINDFLMQEYELIDGGSWPNDHDEIVLIVNEQNELDDLTLYALGLISEEQINAILDAAIQGKDLAYTEQKWSYSEIRGLKFKTILAADCYKKIGDVFVDISATKEGLEVLYNSSSALELKVTGIVRAKENSDTSILKAGIGYTHMLTEYVVEKAKTSTAVLAQQASPMFDIFTGLPFKQNIDTMTDAEKQTAFMEYINALTIEEKAQAYTKIKGIIPEQLLAEQTTAQVSEMNKDTLIATVAYAYAMGTGMSTEEITPYIENMSEDELKAIATPIISAMIKEQYAQIVSNTLDSTMPTDELRASALDAEKVNYTAQECAVYYAEVTEFSESTYEQNLTQLGCLDLDVPSSIKLYASSFEAKDVLEQAIKEYNASVGEEGQIKYTDYVGLLMSSITTIVKAVTYVLIAFVAISLIVSSIMIGVITLISVQERTKEIGILRAIGASKRDVSSMFNAETIIIGFTSGLLGVIVTYLLCIPINIILHALTGVANLNAILPIGAAVILVTISTLLTLVSGIIPSKSAAKKDPVVALRNE